MPRAKKTTETEAVKPAAKPKVSRAGTKSTNKSATPKPATKTSSASKKIESLEKRLLETENKLNSLISVIHSDLQRGHTSGPEGLAAKLRKSGLV